MGSAGEGQAARYRQLLGCRWWWPAHYGGGREGPTAPPM